jgi:hypothetical protein
MSLLDLIFEILKNLSCAILLFQRAIVGISLMTEIFKIIVKHN